MSKPKDTVVFVHRGTAFNVTPAIANVLGKLTKEAEDNKSAALKLVRKEGEVAALASKVTSLENQLKTETERYQKCIQNLISEIDSAKLEKFMGEAKPAEILKSFFGVAHSNFLPNTCEKSS